jgi:hypothetical protein
MWLVLFHHQNWLLASIALLIGWSTHVIHDHWRQWGEGTHTWTTKARSARHTKRGEYWDNEEWRKLNDIYHEAHLLKNQHVWVTITGDSDEKESTPERNKTKETIRWVITKLRRKWDWKNEKEFKTEWTRWEVQDTQSMMSIETMRSEERQMKKKRITTEWKKGVIILSTLGLLSSCHQSCISESCWFAAVILLIGA